MKQFLSRLCAVSSIFAVFHVVSATNAQNDDTRKKAQSTVRHSLPRNIEIHHIQPVKVGQISIPNPDQSQPSPYTLFGDPPEKSMPYPGLNEIV